MHNTWLRQFDKYPRQRASLELGWLTEEILPRDALKRILANARRKDLYAPDAEWYYANVRIDPLWEDDKWLVFRAKLPLTDNIKYLRYTIWTWPVPGNTSQYTVKIQVPKEIAFQTQTGGLFDPTVCQGSRPMICRKGPVYNRQKMQCP